MDINSLSKKHKILILLALPLLLITFYYFSVSKEDSSNYATSAEQTEVVETNQDNTFFVEITGQVNSPGVYQLSKKLLVIELIALAGGLNDNADLQIVHRDISLSNYVEPLQKIYIPSIQEGNTASASTSAGNNKLISINNASVQELDALPGVGPATAEKIISARPYASIEDLKQVDGIGDSLYNKIVSQISL